MNEIELKPCPFCGSKAELIDRTYYEHDDQKPECFDVRCTNNGCYLDEGADYWNYKDEVIELWNKRA